MRREDFSDQASGELVDWEGALHFVPNLLPPRLAYSENLVRRLTDAAEALGELKALSAIAPNAQLLIQPFLKREAVLSSKIEGTVTRLDQLLLFEADEDNPPDNPADAREVGNYVSAMFHGLKLLESLPLCLRLIREVHAKLMAGVRGDDRRPGEFRTRDVVIGRSGATKTTARFVPPPANRLGPLLDNLEHFLNQPGDVSIVAQLAIAHYQFEAIHPFFDGNGRLGRLMIAFMLHARDVLPKPMLYLSAYFEEHDREYRDHLLAVSQHAAWDAWILFVAEGIREQAGDVVARTNQLLQLQTTYRHNLQEKGHSANALRLVDQLFTSPYITATGVAAILDVTFKTAGNTIDRLMEEHILQELDPRRRRNRVYVAPQIVQLLMAEKATATVNPQDREVN